MTAVRESLLLLTVVATVFCTAINCYTWRVAYPLWKQVAAEDFSAHHGEYLRRLGPVITLPHVVMFFSSGLLLRWRPGCCGLASAALIFGLDAGVVLVSLFWAGPIHTRFERAGGLSGRGLRQLIGISALRSAMMLTATGVVCRVLFACLAGK